MTSRRLAPPVIRSALLLALGTAGACNQVFGIEEAHVDPTIRPSGGIGAQGGTSNTGNGGSNAAQGGTSAGGSAGQHAYGGMTSMAGAGGSAGQAGDTSSGGLTAAGSGGVGEGGSGGAGGGPGVPSLCEEYCNTVTQYCTGENLQYADLEQCLRVCEFFPQGVVGEPDGHSVACRLKYAGKARYAGGTELAAYCRQGGPGGDGRCGSNCQGFCDITQATCNQGETAPYFYPSRQACENSCATLPDIPFVYGSKSSADGNSVQCRLFHVMSAAMADPGEHCAHVLGVTLCEASN
ncbi:MAG: hypothetical protein ACOY0T_18760 [Myxococcota bacterium]